VTTDKNTRPTRLHASLTADGGASVTCHRYTTRPPILSLWSGPVHMSIAAPDRSLDDAPLTFARELARAAAVFLAECVRFAKASKSIPAEPSSAESGPEKAAEAA
jgi:hypothetical protein